MAAVKSRRRAGFLMFLVLCCLLSAVLAAPATRSLKSVKASALVHDAAAITQVGRRRMSSEESKGGEGRRMEIELTDYPGPGANKGHEPVTPPKR